MLCCLVQNGPRPQAIYIPGWPIRARPLRAQGGPQGPGPQGPRGPTRAQGSPQGPGPQGPGPQGPKGAHKGPGGPTRAQGGPQGPRGAHKGPAHKGPAHKGPAHKGPGGPTRAQGAHKGPAHKGPGSPQGPKGAHKESPQRDKTVQGSPWGDALQQAGSDAAIESFWRCKFVEIWARGRFVRSLGSMSWARRFFFPASKCSKMSNKVTKHKKVIKTGSKPLYWGPTP